MTFFGFIWLGWGLSVVRDVPWEIWATLFLLAVVLLSAAVVAVRRGRKMMNALGVSGGDFWAKRRKAFNILTLLEGVGCAVVLLLTNLLHRPEWIPIGISLVVGLHFLPLGKILGVASYFWVGSMIVLWDVLALTASQAWNPSISVPLATGVILWATSIYVLIRSFRVVSPQQSF
jgi:hypothetical protein